MDESIKSKKKDGWFDVQFIIEAMGISKDVVVSSLTEHVKKLGDVKDVNIYEKKFSPVDRIEKPIRDVKEGHSQIVELKLVVKNLYLLLNIIMVYGPSSVEILGPGKKEVKIDEIQNISNLLAAVVHQFAHAGIGGILISPQKK